MLPKSAVGDQSFEAAADRVVAVLEDGGKDGFRVLSAGGEDQVEAGPVRGERFLAQHMLAGGQGIGRDPGMRSMIRTDGNCVHRWVRQDLPVIGRRLADAELFGQAASLVDYQVTGIGDGDVRLLLIALHVGRGDHPAADDGGSA